MFIHSLLPSRFYNTVSLALILTLLISYPALPQPTEIYAVRQTASGESPVSAEIGEDLGALQGEAKPGRAASGGEASSLADKAINENDIYAVGNLHYMFALPGTSLYVKREVLSNLGRIISKASDKKVVIAAVNATERLYSPKAWEAMDRRYIIEMLADISARGITCEAPEAIRAVKRALVDMAQNLRKSYSQNPDPDWKVDSISRLGLAAASGIPDITSMLESIFLRGDIHKEEVIMALSYAASRGSTPSVNALRNILNAELFEMYHDDVMVGLADSILDSDNGRPSDAILDMFRSPRPAEKNYLTPMLVYLGRTSQDKHNNSPAHFWRKNQKNSHRN